MLDVRLYAIAGAFEDVFTSLRPMVHGVLDNRLRVDGLSLDHEREMLHVTITGESGLCLAAEITVDKVTIWYSSDYNTSFCDEIKWSNTSIDALVLGVPSFVYRIAEREQRAQYSEA